MRIDHTYKLKRIMPEIIVYPILADLLARVATLGRAPSRQQGNTKLPALLLNEHSLYWNIFYE